VDDDNRVVIGMDPHKRSVTIEVMTSDEQVLGGGRFGTDVEGFTSMLAYVAAWPDRVWAIEGCEGIGRHVAQRLIAQGEPVVDVPAKLSARVRVFATGQGRKTDDTDAHSIALVGVRMSGLRAVVDNEQLELLRLLVDRRRRLGEEHTRMVCQLHQLLLELVPGGAKRDLSAAQARKLLAGVRPRDVVGKTRKQHAMELVVDLERIYQRKKASNKELIELIKATGTGLLDLHGIGPSGAARLLVEVGDITRFPDRGHFASWTGTAPIDASSGDRVRHRLSRGGNRQINVVRAHHGHRPVAQPDRGPRLLRPQDRCRQVRQRGHALPQAPPVRHRLPHHAQRPGREQSDGPGRTPGRVTSIQRGRLTSPHRLFGQVTSRTRQDQA
jgi:transposase